MNKQTNMNIPVASVSAAMDCLAKLYAAAVETGVSLATAPSVMLWSAPGIGKSQGVRQLAQKLEQKLGRRVVVTDVRLLLFNPVDLRGLPTANEDKTLAVWLKPKIFQMDPSEDVINILFLDELSAAPQAVQASAYQICLDRQVGEHCLPDNTLVIAAGNRTTDQSVSYKMPKALCNRMMHFHIEADLFSWKRWALEHDMDPRIIGYLSFDSSRLCVDPAVSDTAYPTPRSWQFVDWVLRTTGMDPAMAHMMIASCVGEDTAVEFETWCRVYRHLPSVEDIFDGQCSKYPKSHDVLYALVTGIVSAVYAMRQTISAQTLDNIWEYAVRFPADYAGMLFEDLNAIPEVSLKMMKSPALSRFLNKN